MPEVGFYHLQRSTLDQALPKILGTVLQRGLKAVVLCGSPERVESLNGLLWTFQEDAFLPHGSAKDGYADRQPVYLTAKEERPNEASVLCVVDGLQPETLGDYDRVLDFFDGRDQFAVESARERWRAYKAANLVLTYWQQTEQGGWEKKAEHQPDPASA